MKFDTMIWKTDENREPSNTSYFRLGWVVLDVPPSNIVVEKSNDFVSMGTLRSTGDVALKSGYSSIDIVVSVPFFGEDQILTKLLKIIAMYKVTPIVELDNKFVRTQLFGTGKYNKLFLASPFFSANNPVAVVLKGFEISIGDQNLSGITAYATLKLSYYNHFPISPWFQMKPNAGIKVWEARIKSYLEKLKKGWEKFKNEIYTPIKAYFPNGTDAPGMYSDQEDNEFTMMGYVYKCVENFHPKTFRASDVVMNTGDVAQQMWENQNFGDDFDRAYCTLLHFEQGYVDNPNDPGGGTKYGIASAFHKNTLAALGVTDIRNLSCEQARMIAKQKFWDAAGCGSAPWPMNLVMLDRAFHSGRIKEAGKLPGRFGSNWKAALDEERQRLIQIANNPKKPKMKTFERCWMNRCDAMEAACLGQRITQFPPPPRECSFCNPANTVQSPAQKAAKEMQDIAALGKSKSVTDVMDTLHKQANEDKRVKEADEYKKHRDKMAQLYAEGWEVDAEKSNNDYITLRMRYYLPFYHTYNDNQTTWAAPMKVYCSRSYKSKILVESINLGFENKFIPIPIQSFSMPFWQHLGGSSMWVNVRATAIADPEEGYCAMLSDLQTLFNIKEHQVIDLKDMIAINPNFTEDVQSVHIASPALNMLGLHKFILSRLNVATNPSHIHTYDVEMSFVENYMYAPRVRGKTGQLQILENRILPNLIKKCLLDTPESEIVAPEVRDMRRRLTSKVVWTAANCATGLSMLRLLHQDLQTLKPMYWVQSASNWLFGDGKEVNPEKLNISEGSECIMYMMSYDLSKIDFEHPSGPAASLEDIGELYISTPPGETKYSDDQVLMVRPYLDTASHLSRAQYEKWKKEEGWPCGWIEEGGQPGDCACGASFMADYEKAGAVASELKNSLIDVFNRFSAQEPCFIKLRDQFKTGNVEGSKYWASFFADGKIFTPCYPDLELPDMEDPAAYIDGVEEPPPDSMTNVYTMSQKISLAMANKIEQHFANMPRWKIASASGGGPTFMQQGAGSAQMTMDSEAVEKAQAQNQAQALAAQGQLFSDIGKTDLSKADDAVKAAFMTNMDGSVLQLHKYQSYNRSFPTFRIYFIEDNAAFIAGVDPESISRFRDWDQFFDYEAVVSIEIAKFKWDVDTAVIRVLNTFGELSTRVMDAGNYHVSEANRDVTKDGEILDYKHKSKRLADGSLVLVETYNDPSHKKDIIPMTKMAVQPGTKIMIKLGYQNNEYLLPVAFSGLVAKVETGEMMTIVCQGHLAELLEPVQGFISEAGGVGELLQRLAGFDEGFDWTAIGKLFSPADWKRRLYKANINAAFTRPLAYRLLSHPSVIHFGRWEYTGSKYNGTALYAYGSSWRLDNGQSNRCVDNVDVLLEQNWQAKTALLGMYPQVDKFWVDDPQEDALWDVFREVTLRHPSHRLMVRPYHQDATLVIKQLGDLYKQSPGGSFTPSQEASVTEKTLLEEYVNGPGLKVIHDLWTKLSADGLLPIREAAVNTYLGQSWKAIVMQNTERKRTWDHYITDKLSQREVTNMTNLGPMSWANSQPGNPFGYATWRPDSDPNATFSAAYLGESDIKELIMSERNIEVAMVCLPPELLSVLRDSYAQFKAQKMRDNPTLAATVSMGEMFRPVQKYFYASSYFNIISNNIRTNADIYNAVTVKDKDTTESDGITVSVDDNLDPQYLKQFYFGSRNVTKHWYSLTARLTNDMKHLYGWSLLIEKLNEMYQGELCILGEPDLMPFDCVIINDAYNQIYGPVEVNSVVHRFSPDEGFITFVEPHLCVRVADLAFAVATGRMNDLFSIATQNEWYYNLDKKYKLQSSGPSKGMAELGERGYPLLEGLIWYSRSIADSLRPDDIQGATWGANFEYFTQLGDAAAALGIHIDRLFAGVSDTFYNSGPYRQPVIMSPLRYKNVPFVAGIRGAKFNSWMQSRKLQYERENTEYANQVAGYERGLRIATDNAPVGTDASTHTVSQGREVYAGGVDAL